MAGEAGAKEHRCLRRPEKAGHGACPGACRRDAAPNSSESAWGYGQLSDARTLRCRCKPLACGDVRASTDNQPSSEGPASVSGPDTQVTLSVLAEQQVWMVATAGIMSLLPPVCAQLGSINPGYVTPVPTMESGCSELSHPPLNGTWMFKAEAEQVRGGPARRGHPRGQALPAPGDRR